MAPDISSTVRVAVVIPCFRVADSICDVIDALDDKVAFVICVDDGCPDGSGDVVEKRFHEDLCVNVIRHDRNQGVGAATVTGYGAALARGADVIVKVDGDGQMDPQQISRLVAPILAGDADYTKGNRFFNPESVSGMPVIRVLGNAGQSFLAKLSTGYWSVFDPANGFTAIHARIAQYLPFEKLHRRYFFETDLLFRLNTVRAVVVDVPMNAIYRGESSNLNILYCLLTFPFLHARNFAKRFVYNYLIRDFNIATINILLGLPLLIFGLGFGLQEWKNSIQDAVFASAGTVMLAALPIIVGTQLVLGFIAHDIANQPTDPLYRRL